MKDQDFVRGIAVALSLIMYNYNETSMCFQIANECGLTRMECMAAGVSEFDMNNLEPVFDDQEAE